jgi:hypothetical protein
MCRNGSWQPTRTTVTTRTSSARTVLRGSLRVAALASIPTCLVIPSVLPRSLRVYTFDWLTSHRAFIFGRSVDSGLPGPNSGMCAEVGCYGIAQRAEFIILDPSELPGIYEHEMAWYIHHRFTLFGYPSIGNDSVG